jgi:hypothetical protein
MQDDIRKRLSDEFFNPCGVLHFQLMAETVNFSSVIKIKAGPYVVGIPLATCLRVKETTCPNIFHLSESVILGPTDTQYFPPNLQVLVIHGYNLSASSQTNAYTETEDGKQFADV